MFGLPHCFYSQIRNFQVNLVDWLKRMVTSRNPEGVLDPKIPEKPTSRALKRALLVALRCVDPNSQKRPKMGHVIHMLEAEESPFRDVCIHFYFKFKSNMALRHMWTTNKLHLTNKC